VYRSFAAGTTVIGYVEGDKVLGAAEIHERAEESLSNALSRRQGTSATPSCWSPPTLRTLPCGRLRGATMPSWCSRMGKRSALSISIR
jgi:hypothetical protein